MTVPERTTPIQYTLKPLYALLPSGAKREALKTVLTAYINSAGKYPSVDNRASFVGDGEGPPGEPSPVYTPPTGKPPTQQPIVSPPTEPYTTPTLIPPSQAQNTPATPATTLSPSGPSLIPNRLPAGPGGQYPVGP